jgi:phosphonate transport system substrate-binding protein
MWAEPVFKKLRRIKVRKLFLLLVAFVTVFALAACGGNDYSDLTLTVYFVPSRPADEILEITEPLEQLLLDELAELGFELAGVEILVSSTYEAAGEALLAGTGDVAFLPGGTYVAYKDVADSPVEVILAATRAGLSKDSMDAADWNDGLATEGDPEYQVAYYKGLIIGGTSAAARTLAEKVNAETALVWDDVKDLNWCVRSATSSSGYIYPAIWLQDNFGKTFDDVEGVVTQTGGYGDTMSSLATGTCDVGTIYADARRDYADEWVGEYGRTSTVWEETDVIGVTSNIMNDTISVSMVNLDQDLVDAIQQAFLNIAQTEAGLEVMAVYSHQGYTVVTDEDYDGARAAADIAGN